MDKETYPNSKVVNLANKLIPVKLDADKPEPAKVAQKYKVEGTPTILFVDPKGNKIHEVDGFLPADQFAAEMQKALKKAPK